MHNIDWPRLILVVMCGGWMVIASFTVGWAFWQDENKKHSADVNKFARNAGLIVTLLAAAGWRWL